MFNTKQLKLIMKMWKETPNHSSLYNIWYNKNYGAYYATNGYIVVKLIPHETPDCDKDILEVSLEQLKTVLADKNSKYIMGENEFFELAAVAGEDGPIPPEVEKVIARGDEHDVDGGYNDAYLKWAFDFIGEFRAIHNAETVEVIAPVKGSYQLVFKCKGEKYDLYMIVMGKRR